MNPYSLSKRHLTLVPMADGRYWAWSCGWWLVDPDTRRVLSHRPLGHLAFRRLPKATRESINAHNVIFTSRPTGDWRRWISDHTLGVPTPFEHRLGGRHGITRLVWILATDGVHAIVQPYGCPKEPKSTVHYTNLHEIKEAPIMPKRTKSNNPTKQSKRTAPVYSIDELL